jgi:hypothetical protein
MLSTMAMACGPLTRITAMPPMPGAVEIAAIVMGKGWKGEGMWG